METRNNNVAALLMAMLLLLSTVTIMGYRGEREWEEEEGEREEWIPRGRRGSRSDKELFLMEEPRVVARTEYGTVKVARGYSDRGLPPPMDIGFIDMEPNSLLLPQYIDANLILFVRKGEARVGSIYDDQMVERDLKTGDIYTVTAGFAFYIENIGRDQNLHIISSIDVSEVFETARFESFIGGGTYPVSILSGFDTKTLTTALNVTDDEVDELLSRQSGGPIIRMGDGSVERMAAPTIEKEEVAKNGEKESSGGWSSWWRRETKKLALGIDDSKEGSNKKKEKERTRKAEGGGPDPYNIYDRKPDFQNAYGWSVAVDENVYQPLQKSGIGVYLVNLTAGSMLAPHVNPMATEYGVVVAGAGRMEVVLPNGTLAMDVDLEEGDAFWVPRYLPFCQIASRSGSMEFFGFTTSAGRNHPQFLVGATSLLRTMMGPELAAAFDVSEEKLQALVTAQRESIILPSPEKERGGRGREKREGREERRGKGEEKERKEEEEEEGGGYYEGEGEEPYIKRYAV